MVASNRTAAWLAVAIGGLLVACGTPAGGDDLSSAATTRPTPATSADPRAVAVLRLDFSTVAGQLTTGDLVPDASGNGHSAVLATSGPPEPLSVIAGPDGEPGAVQFPENCVPAAQAECPRAVLEVADAPKLNPRDNDFTWGANVLVSPDRTSQGSNVVQKGFANGGRSQWKLQVDGDEGRPSCVLVGVGESEIHLAAGDASIADGRWHDVVCRRVGDKLSIEVDGQLEGTTPLPVDLAIEPPGPVRIGGKNSKQSNDQYYGAVSDVFLTLKSP